MHNKTPSLTFSSLQFAECPEELSSGNCFRWSFPLQDLGMIVRMHARSVLIGFGAGEICGNNQKKDGIDSVDGR